MQRMCLPFPGFETLVVLLAAWNILKGSSRWERDVPPLWLLAITSSSSEVTSSPLMSLEVEELVSSPAVSSQRGSSRSDSGDFPDDMRGSNWVKEGHNWRVCSSDDLSWLLAEFTVVRKFFWGDPYVCNLLLLNRVTLNNWILLQENHWRTYTINDYASNQGLWHFIKL